MGKCRSIFGILHTYLHCPLSMSTCPVLARASRMPSFQSRQLFLLKLSFFNFTTRSELTKYVSFRNLVTGSNATSRTTVYTVVYSFHHKTWRAGGDGDGDGGPPHTLRVQYHTTQVLQYITVQVLLVVMRHTTPDRKKPNDRAHALHCKTERASAARSRCQTV